MNSKLDNSTEQNDKIQPVFDLELFMLTCQEKRIDGETMKKVTEMWDKWMPFAKVKFLKTKEQEYLLAYLDEFIEKEVDSIWKESPSEGFMANALAQVMCMGLVQSAIPEMEGEGCAAFPKITDELIKALEDENVPFVNSCTPSLSRRYAVVTNYPFEGSCGVCSLSQGCSQKEQGHALRGQNCSSSNGPETFVLQGFE